MLRVIRELAPSWVVGENVSGILHIAATDVISDLECEGYNTVVFDFEAAAVGAPHRRERVAFVANRVCNRSKTGIADTEGGKERKSTKSFNGCEDVADTDNTGNGTSCSGTHGNGQTQNINGRQSQSEPCRHGFDVSNADNGSGTLWGDRQFSAVAEVERQWRDNGRRTPEYVTGEWWATEPNVGRVAYGIPSRVDRLKCLGNAVVPRQFFPTPCTEGEYMVQ
jgi:DNA (cytosine-5)-methyltransferase 1